MTVTPAPCCPLNSTFYGVSLYNWSSYARIQISPQELPYEAHTRDNTQLNGYLEYDTFSYILVCDILIHAKN